MHYKRSMAPKNVTHLKIMRSPIMSIEIALAMISSWSYIANSRNLTQYQFPFPSILQAPLPKI